MRQKNVVFSGYPPYKHLLYLDVDAGFILFQRLKNLMGRKGFVKELKEYWDVATYFEMAVLESLHGHSAAYDTAVVAASRMYFFNSPSWHLRSTLKNIRLIRCR